MHSTAERSWASTVAQAAPATPMPRGTMNTMSSTMFSRAENTSRNMGVRLSPNARRMLEIMLYSTVAPVPSRMTNR